MTGVLPLIMPPAVSPSSGLPLLEGIISLDPCRVQCQGCGRAWGEGRRPAVTIILSALEGLIFHGVPPTRECRDCRSGCGCHTCVRRRQDREDPS